MVQWCLAKLFMRLKMSYEQYCKIIPFLWFDILMFQVYHIYDLSCESNQSIIFFTRIAERAPLIVCKSNYIEKRHI